jgi:Protein of unknown function (DUF1203)
MRSEFKKREGKIMLPIRIVAIPTVVAEAVRSTMRAPVYGFPAHVEAATDAAPCRHCLRLIAPGEAHRILFTYDRFSGVESLPQPGPIYVRAESCPRYAEDAAFRRNCAIVRALEGYARGRRLVAQQYVEDGEFEPAIETLFGIPEIDYLQVHSMTAGCFTFRIERAAPSSESAR